MKDQQWINLDEQTNMGLRKPKLQNNQTFVPALRQPEFIRLPDQVTTHTIDVTPTSQSLIEVRTNAVDRAKGFLISSIPLYAAFGISTLLIAVLGFNVPLLSITAIGIFFLTFTSAWLAAYSWSLMYSSEGIAFYEAVKKWDVIKEEQRERWDFYNRQIKD